MATETVEGGVCDFGGGDGPGLSGKAILEELMQYGGY